MTPVPLIVEVVAGPEKGLVGKIVNETTNQYFIETYINGRWWVLKKDTTAFLETQEEPDTPIILEA